MKQSQTESCSRVIHDHTVRIDSESNLYQKCSHVPSGNQSAPDVIRVNILISVYIYIYLYLVLGLTRCANYNAESNLYQKCSQVPSGNQSAPDEKVKLIEEFFTDGL